MKNIKNYDQYVNESLKGILNNILNTFKKTFDVKSNKDKDKLEEDLTSLMLSYKNEILTNIDHLDKKSINQIFSKVKHELEPNIINDFNLDSFFRGLISIISVKKNAKINVEKYFKSYINNLPNRIEMIYNQLNEPKDYSDDEEFEELRRIKKNVILKIPKKRFKSEKIPLQIELLKMQEWMKKSKYRLLIVCEGRDSAGKGSAIKTITEFLQPKYFDIETFDIPTKEEQEDWFGRYEEVMPAPGHLTFFDRSWYNRAVNDPVMGYCSQEEYEKFMTDVVPFEDNLKKEGVHMIKFWFSVTKEMQELRFKMRQASPLKYWKFSENDLKTMSRWDQFTAYKERMFNETSTPQNPWIVVDSDDKRLAQLNVMRYILNVINYEEKEEENIGQPFPEIIIPMI